MKCSGVFKTANYYQDLRDHVMRFYFAKDKDIQTLQDIKLQQTVKQAQMDIDFYQKSFLKHGFDAREFKGLEQIKNVPILDPADYFSHTQAERSRPGAVCIMRSSGTSGTPKNTYLSWVDFQRTRRISYLRMLFLNGFDPFYKNLFLTSANSSYKIQPKWFWKFGLMQERIINATISLREQASVFDAYRPDVFNCLSSDGVLLADFIRTHTQIKHKAKYIFTTGEMPSDKNNKQILDTLGSKIIDFYASTEAGIIAWQCSKTQGYHINVDQLYVEIIDGQRICVEGQAGEVVLTTLDARCSPLIRYRTGDIAVLKKGKCQCGSSFPCLSQIQGRANDFLTAVNGQRVSPYLLMSTMDRIKEVKQYQIHQSGLAEYRFYIRPHATVFNQAFLYQKIKNEYTNILGQQSNILVVPFEQRITSGDQIKRKVIIFNA